MLYWSQFKINIIKSNLKQFISSLNNWEHLKSKEDEFILFIGILIDF